jgi:menaquinone-dependent protoporphyrinogen oxidase
MPEPRVLVAYHSADGHTAEIATRIAELLGKAGASVDVLDAADAPAPTGYDGVVLGDSIHAGRHSRALTTYLTKHLAEVQARPNALFQVSLTSAKTDEKSAAEVRQYVSKLLDKTGFDPDMVGMFAGAVVYTRYGWLKRRMMRRIVSSEGDDTDVTRDYDYTDWAAVEHFAEDVYRLVTSEDHGHGGERG